MEILSILYQRDLTHKELADFKKRFIEYFNDYQKQTFPTYGNDHIQQLEQRLRQQQSEALARQERVCCLCRRRAPDLRKGNGPDEYYCDACLKYSKKDGDVRMVMQ